MFGLRRFSSGVLLLLSGRLGSFLRLGCLLLLLLLLGGSVDDSLFDEVGGSYDFGDVGLVDDGVEETEGVGEGSTDFSVENLRETESEGDGDEDVGEGEALSDEEGAGSEGLLEVFEELEGAGLGSLDVSLVVGLESGKGGDPRSEGTDEVRVGPC
jgi:hypothetical protein